MRVALLTREYPPAVYGGAGVHVEYLSRELARRLDLEVHCFGAPRGSPLVAATYQPWERLAGAAPSAAALQTMSVDLAMAKGVEGADLVHSHTWYANLGGHLAGLLWEVPHVATTHSLEPLRPWKAEQLGGGYALSRFCERTGLEGADAIIAVSEQMRRDVLSCYPAVDSARVEVIHNGIDPDEYRPVADTSALVGHGVDPERPSVLFLGRITRQKGIVHLLEAAPEIDPAAQLVLLAGAPDTPEIATEVRGLYEQAQRRRGGVVWIETETMLPRREVIQFLSHAGVLVCPSVYEPFGLVNLEAMACETAVVASAVGGIPEIVVDGETGYLVPCEIEAVTGAAPDPAAAQRFASGIAARVNELVADPETARRMGRAGRRRVVEHFDWRVIAAQTVALYARVLGEAGDRPAGRVR
ncbi:MAG: alpha-maltose-phosphate synthase [Chloroflexota bacterium]|nr:alpha-maltose-phosphate synthase [Chloroflexota bacterium]